MEYKTFNLEYKEDDNETGVISGYGSVYGNLDRGFDVVVKGAFDESLASGRSVKFLYQHDPHNPIGVWTSIVSDDHGLKVDGKLADTTQAQDVLKLIKMGAISGLSIGYRVVESHRDENGNRFITKADLWEISAVTFAMNEAATITSAKADDEAKSDDNAELMSLMNARLAILRAE